MSRRFVSNLEKLIDEWIYATNEAFKGNKEAKNIFRKIQGLNYDNSSFLKEGEISLQEEIKSEIYRWNNYSNIKEGFDLLVNHLDYDYLPSWIQSYNEGKNLNEMNSIKYNNINYIVPSRETMKEIYQGFFIFNNFFLKNGIENEKLICFLNFLIEIISLIQ